MTIAAAVQVVGFAVALTGTAVVGNAFGSPVARIGLGLCTLFSGLAMLTGWLRWEAAEG